MNIAHKIPRVKEIYFGNMHINSVKFSPFTRFYFFAARRKKAPRAMPAGPFGRDF